VRVYVCQIVRDLETSTMRRLGPELDSCFTGTKNVHMYVLITADLQD